ncbi:MAG: hypothetical protein Q7S11_00635, partial [bacterium]|nr:hypothetical protein [bacterium]
MLKTLFLAVSLAVFDHTRKTQVQAVLLGIFFVLLMAPSTVLFFMPQQVDAFGVTCTNTKVAYHVNGDRETAYLYATHALPGSELYYGEFHPTYGSHYIYNKGCPANVNLLCSYEHGYAFACDATVEQYPNPAIVPPVIIPPTIPPVSVSLWLSSDATSATIDYNQTATLYWSSKNAKSCTASGDWTGPKTVNSANDNTGGYDGDER